MTDEVFLDSNVLLYACSSAPADAGKRRVAEDLILNHLAVKARSIPPGTPLGGWLPYFQCPRSCGPRATPRSKYPLRRFMH
jgi:hypothetical protein